jgi:peptidoglycan/xylan/chitin deacetylase (PgdA/CDA1 family)
VRVAVLFVLTACIATPAFAIPRGLVEPHMRIAPGGRMPQVALTLDACEGGVDMRILDALIANGVRATIFTTGRWIGANPAAVKLLKSHADLFEIEDHGEMHIPAVIGRIKPYGLTPAGTPAAVLNEVGGGAQAVHATFGSQPVWYRDATALYSPDAITLIESVGFRIGGFSLNGDFGATSPAAAVAKRIASAKDGDVIISHVNQPTRVSGAGVAEGILRLKARGFKFVRLADVQEIAG